VQPRERPPTEQEGRRRTIPPYLLVSSMIDDGGVDISRDKIIQQETMERFSEAKRMARRHDSMVLLFGQHVGSLLLLLVVVVATAICSAASAAAAAFVFTVPTPPPYYDAAVAEAAGAVLTTTTTTMVARTRTSPGSISDVAFFRAAAQTTAAAGTEGSPRTSVVSDGRALLSTLEQTTAATSPGSSSTSFILVADAAGAPFEPSKADVLLLRQAFAEFYGPNRDLEKSKELLSEAIERWQKQPADEKAGLYRVRGDCYMLLSLSKEAYDDYDTAVKLLRGPGGQQADPAELPAALLGRARAGKCQQRTTAADDYRQALILTSREEWDTDEENLQDGATRNPYAAWEWGSALRLNGDWIGAARAHNLASDAFDDVGDRARSVISLIDSGIDYAAANDVDNAVAVLEKAIPKTKGVESRDVELLRRVLAKEGEGRIALAATLWDKPGQQRVDAENQLGDACVRLDQMQVDAAQRGGSQKASASSSASDASITTATMVSPLAFSIDDDEGNVAREISCYKFRDPKFLNKLGWPESLQKKVEKLQTLR